MLFLGAIDRIELWSAEEFDKETVSPSDPKVVAEQARAFFGVEVTEAVEAIRNLYRVPKHKPSARKHLFLCHPAKDKVFVRRLAADLTAKGITVWFDEWEMLPGDSLYERIQEGIREARKKGSRDLGVFSIHTTTQDGQAGAWRSQVDGRGGFGPVANQAHFQLEGKSFSQYIIRDMI